MKFQRYFSLIQTSFISFFLFCFAHTWASPLSQTLSCERAISNLNELATAVTENAPFSNSKEHRRLFKIYQTQFLGKEKDTGRTGLESVMHIVNRYPELSKPAFREYILTLEQRTYEPPQSLRDVIQRLKNSANQFQAQLFQPEANIGFWQKLLMPLKKEDLEDLSRQEKKTKQQEHKTQFREYFDQVFTPEDHEVLKDYSMTNTEKTVAVYRILERIRTQMIEEGRNVQALSQAMVDLVHTSGFRNSHYITLLKSQNALDQIRGLKQILSERDIVALTLNFENYFSELIHSLNVDHPTGSTKKENLSQILSGIQKEIKNKPHTISGKQVLRVRALSLQESPFRGCLGTDCSTTLYFDLALDPNFIYFTLTNEELKSSGHITVVLGTAFSEKKKSQVKIAFVDKIQNVPEMMILPMLSAVRLSLEELGYRLGLPVDVGDHDGLSNMEMTRTYIDLEVNPLFTHQLRNFKPHKNKYNFYQGYSRAYLKPMLLEFERWEGDFTIEAGEIHTKSSIPEELKAADLYQDILSLQDSNKEKEQIQFIDQLKLLTEIEEFGLSKDFAEDHLRSKIKDKQVSFKVRKKALYTLFELLVETNWDMINREEILNILRNFSLEEQTEILGEMSNWKTSNKMYKQWFINTFSKNVIENSDVKDVINSPLRQFFNVHVRINGERGLLQVIRRSDPAMVLFLLKHGVNMNARDLRGETVLFELVEEYNFTMILLLLDNGIDPNTKNNLGETVLFKAVRMGDLTMVQLLLDNGADPHTENKAGETAFSKVMRGFDQAMGEIFLDHEGITYNQYLYSRFREIVTQLWSRFF